ncbi:SGNH/GDSL hydrolase family protein [Nannocystis pusilla]|uniref:SGNH/GDSL hydrolase family protein n=1 Tax=Nannocystis pusilla TaxID=889268 RepID=UPI003B762342
MTRWIIGPVAALAVGCAQGAPLDGDTSGTLGTTAATAMPTSTEPTTTSGTTTETGGTTTTSTSDGETLSSETDDTATTTTGEPTVLGEYYPFDEVHSPLTADVAASLAAIKAKGTKTDGVFAKVGGSSTASTNFMHCLADAVQIMELPAELQPTVDFFNMTAAGMGATSFSRVSLAAMAGWGGADVLAGMPSPLANEVTEISPRFALVLLGTAELEVPPPEGVFTFADNLTAVVDALIAGGTIPILSTMPTRTMPAGIDVYVPRYNAFVRALAQGRKIPLIDLNLVLAGLPGFGLAADGIDLSVALGGDMVTPAPCAFGFAGTTSGYNRRNLATLEALARVKPVVVDGAAPPDATAPTLLGAGTLAEPIVIPGLPFADMRSTADSPSDEIDAYAGACMSMGEDGPEFVYELEISEATKIRALVFDQGNVDVDLHLMTLTDAGTCVKRADRELEGPLQPGTYYIVVDTLGTATPGEFGLVVLPEV